MGRAGLALYGARGRGVRGTGHDTAADEDGVGGSASGRGMAGKATIAKVTAQGQVTKGKGEFGVIAVGSRDDQAQNRSRTEPQGRRSSPEKSRRRQSGGLALIGGRAPSEAALREVSLRPHSRHRLRGRRRW